MGHRTFPKDGLKKLKAIIQELKAQITSLQKENKFLRQELENLVKPVRERKQHQDKSKLSYDEWRKDFTKRFKDEVLSKK